MRKIEQAELFAEAESAAGPRGFPAEGPVLPDIEDMPPELSKLFELSVNAFYAALYAQMSGLPIEGEISRFIRKTGGASGRASADRAASDRGDPDTLAVLRAAGKVQHEIHRITGFLRFSPDPGGIYTARCAPDYFILPALAEHFTLRFGETPWAVIDEKRGLRLSREKGGDACISRTPEPPSAAIPQTPANDCWESLWRLYHRSVNNEGRKNLKLQRQFMPERYRRYLSEFK